MKINSNTLCVIMRLYPGEIILDPEDYDRFKFSIVHKLPNGYVHLKVKGKTVGLHQAITNFKYPQVDHKNQLPWDCRKENLRPATQGQNQHNMSIRTTNKSGYKGVSWSKSNNKWVAQITINKTKNFLGGFDTPEEAHEVYKKYAEKYYGDYANT